MNYNYGVKRNWRRWVWNRIKEKISVPVEQATGFYLIGEDNADLKVALSKKFNKKNLIGIDLNKKCVETARKSGVSSAKISLQNAILGWDTPIDFVNADFCCGYNEQIWEFIGACFRSKSVSHKTVIAINMLRGRDKSKYFYEASEGESEKIPKYMKKQLDLRFGKNFSDKSRSLMFLTYFGEVFFYLLSGGRDLSGCGFIKQCLFYNMLFRVCDFSFKSYNSNAGNMVMDSIVYKHPVNNYFEEFKIKIHPKNLEIIPKTEKHRLAALKAIRKIKAKKYERLL